MTMQIERRTHTAQGERTWRISDYLCAFQDSERHLGHVTKADNWHAYDATHANPQQNGIRYLGEFTDLAAAMAAVEASVAAPCEREISPLSVRMPAWIF
jgi:hypothetical protein